MIKLLGIPFDANSSYLRGAANGPSKLRFVDDEGSANKFAEEGQEIRESVQYKDLGDLAFDSDDPERAYQKIKTTVLNEIKEGAKLISIGGDHSISFPILESHSRYYPELNVLQFDAHSDLYDNFEDNPYSHASPFARLMEKEYLGSLTQVGIRAMTTHQREQAKRFGVKVIEMNAVKKKFLKKLKAPLYISLDLDVLDPAYAPGVSHHEPGGMSSRQLIDLIQAIDVEIIGADIVELNPERDVNHMTAMIAYKLFKEIASKMMTK